MREVAANAKLRKAFVSDEIKVDDPDSRTVRFQITTDAVDRDNDTIAPGGWKTTDYLKNPVVLFAHDYRRLPVARTLSLIPTDHGLSAVAQFPDVGVDDFADKVYAFVKSGFLNATSVGFRPLKWTFNEERGGVDFIEQSLLEFSICPVPSNPQALVEARAAGVDLAPLTDWAEQILDTTPDHAGLWLPKAQAERLIKLLDNDRLTIALAPVKDAAKDQPPAADGCQHGECPTDVGKEQQCAMTGCPMRTQATAATIPVEKEPDVPFLDLDEPVAEMRLFLELDEDEEPTVDLDEFKALFSATVRDAMAGLVAHELSVAIRRARGQAV